MKKSSIYLAISVTTLSLIITFVLPSKTHAQVTCPAGYTCTPIVKTTTVACPTGYTCTRISSASAADASANTTNTSTHTLSTGLNYTLVNTTATQSSLNIVAPNGGSYQTGSLLNIQWTVTGLTQANNSLGLAVYETSLGSTHSILSMTVGNLVSNGQVSSSGSYSWTIPATAPAGIDYIIYLSNSRGWKQSLPFTIAPITTNTTANTTTNSASLVSSDTVAAASSASDMINTTQTVIPDSSTLPISTAALTPGGTYPFTVDYSKSVADLAQSAGFGNKIDLNILAGMFPTSSIGMTNLAAQQLSITDIIPNYSSGTLTCSKILSGIKADGYRPLNLQELLSLSLQYPNILKGNGGIGIVWGSLVKVTSAMSGNTDIVLPNGSVRNGGLPSLTFMTPDGKYIFNVVPGNSTFAPVISSNAISNKNVCIESDRYIGSASSLKILVVKDSTYTPSVPTIASLPTISQSGILILPQKFSVSVNYDHPDWGKESNWMATAKVNSFVNDYNTTGTKNVTIQLVRTYGINKFNGSNTAFTRSSPVPQGYRLASANEMAALNNQYPNARMFETNKLDDLAIQELFKSLGGVNGISNAGRLYGDGMSSLGTLNMGCGGAIPWIDYGDGHFDDRQKSFNWPASIPMLYPVVKI